MPRKATFRCLEICPHLISPWSQAQRAAEKAAKALFVPETEDEPDPAVDAAAEVAEKVATASQQASAAQAAEVGMVHRLSEASNQSGGLEIRKTQGLDPPPPHPCMSFQLQGQRAWACGLLRDGGGIFHIFPGLSAHPPPS